MLFYQNVTDILLKYYWTFTRFYFPAELGDYDPSRHSSGYVSEFRFISAQTEEMEAEVEDAHRKMSGLLPAEAELMYLEKVKWLDMYGVDLHPVIVSSAKFYRFINYLILPI